jgi:hypothetical protein
LESRVLASPSHSYIWTRIPASLSRLRGSTSPAVVGGIENPVHRLIREKFDLRVFAFSSTASAGMWFPVKNQSQFMQQAPWAQQLSPIQNLPARPQRGGLLSSLGSIFGR